MTENLHRQWSLCETMFHYGWSFLVKDEKKQLAKPKIPLPEHLQIRPVTPVEKYIKIVPSPPVPQTTQGLIGWRSSVPGLELERYYQIRSSKGAFYKDLKWPNEPTD
uniref:Ciliary microtubule inner protein 1 n=1 Tax=Naja naja TaxID=35670 RepID=A0A8C6X2E2_NAJNA